MGWMSRTCRQQASGEQLKNHLTILESIVKGMFCPADVHLLLMFACKQYKQPSWRTIMARGCKVLLLADGVTAAFRQLRLEAALLRSLPVSMQVGMLMLLWESVVFAGQPSGNASHHASLCRAAGCSSAVAVVPQDTVLFNDTILQNIRSVDAPHGCRLCRARVTFMTNNGALANGRCHSNSNTSPVQLF